MGRQNSSAKVSVIIASHSDLKEIQNGFNQTRFVVSIFPFDRNWRGGCRRRTTTTKSSSATGEPVSDCLADHRHHRHFNHLSPAGGERAHGLGRYLRRESRRSDEGECRGPG